MDLSFRDLGGRGTPLIILHGMFGSSKNWIVQGNALTHMARVFALDLRNHGDSPHSESHTLVDLTGDLENWIMDRFEETPVLMGHSMGGAAAMAYALHHPEITRALIVVDIAPKSYRFRHDRELSALRMDLSGYRSRRDLENAMESLVPEIEVRRFLLMNAERTPSGFQWKIDPDKLFRSTAVAELDGLEGHYPGPTLFLFGEESPYYSPDDLPGIHQLFPAARLEIIQGAGHWLHHTHSDAFHDAVRRFLLTLKRGQMPLSGG